ncbi:MAG: HAMP domain-containing protein [Actinobacteria bacterium]|nr:HAMP domain-containing protein [Actinomycetota bacterium]
MSITTWTRLALLATILAGGIAAVFGITHWSTTGKIGAGLALLAIFLLITYIQAKTHAARLRELTQAASRIAEGESSVRVRVWEGEELADIARSLNSVSGALRSRTSLYAAEQEQAGEILAVMADGVLVLDETGRIVRANATAAKLLDAPLEQSIGKRVVDVVRSFPAIELMAKALVAAEPLLEKLELPGPRYISVELVPLRESHPALEPDTTLSTTFSGYRGRQVLLILHDETSRVTTARVRRDFAANVSHELKTPLAGLKLLADTLQHAVVEDPVQAAHFAQRLSAEIGRLSDLVNDLLTLASLERRKAALPPDFRRVDMTLVARTVADEAHDRLARADLTFEFVADRPATVMGDEVQLSTVVKNLMDNAIRFTDVGGSVSMWVEVDENEHLVKLEVRDTGIGIPRNEQTRIFERFYRVDKARSRATGGTGLGLSIVKHIVEQHQGVIAMDSTLGVGSSFTVSLPLYQGPLVTDHPAPSTLSNN